MKFWPFPNTRFNRPSPSLSVLDKSVLSESPAESNLVRSCELWRAMESPSPSSGLSVYDVKYSRLSISISVCVTLSESSKCKSMLCFRSGEQQVVPVAELSSGTVSGWEKSPSESKLCERKTSLSKLESFRTSGIFPSVLSEDILARFAAIISLSRCFIMASTASHSDIVFSYRVLIFWSR